jgi:hypothetical protein
MLPAVNENEIGVEMPIAVSCVQTRIIIELVCRPFRD